MKNSFQNYKKSNRNFLKNLIRKKNSNQYFLKNSNRNKIRIDIFKKIRIEKNSIRNSNRYCSLAWIRIRIRIDIVVFATWL